MGLIEDYHFFKVREVIFIVTNCISLLIELILLLCDFGNFNYLGDMGGKNIFR